MRRDWNRALAKREYEGNRCRVCGATDVELAHVAGRVYDLNQPLLDAEYRRGEVSPDRVVPLCRAHHRAYDAHEFDLTPWLTLVEQLQAVADLGSIEAARVRLIPRRMREAA